MKTIIVSKNLENCSDDEIIFQLAKELNADYEFHLISPKEEKYKIEEIKNFIYKLSKKSLTSYENTVFVLKNGDNLSPICQNALLKTLEDSNYSIAIIVKNADSLLPTIKSRCQTVFIKNETENQSDEKINFFDSNLIPSLTKLERETLLQKMKRFLDSMNFIDFKKTLLIDVAIRKIEANCKVESVLQELVWKAKGC